jgi:hypothetical protein
MFLLYCAINDMTAAHQRNSSRIKKNKTVEVGTYLDLEISILNKIF